MHIFRENIWESSRNVSETTPWFHDTSFWGILLFDNSSINIVRWPDQGTPQNFGETILLHFLIDMMVLIKNQEGVEV